MTQFGDISGRGGGGTGPVYQSFMLAGSWRGNSLSIDNDYDLTHGIVILHEFMSQADLIESIHL